MWRRVPAFLIDVAIQVVAWIALLLIFGKHSTDPLATGTRSTLTIGNSAYELRGAATLLHDGISGLLELPWDVWSPTVGVSEISISTEPSSVPSSSPPEVTSARVSIVGYGFAPGVPVTTKWNNAFGFPDNGVGANSIKLQSPVPNSHGRFAFQVVHRAVRRPAKEWYWDANAQLVIVAQQGKAGSSS